MHFTRFALLLSLVVVCGVLAAPAYAAPVTCDELQNALDNSVEDEVVELQEGEVCDEHYDLPSQRITLQGGGTTGATLDGDTGEGRIQILSGSNVGGTTIRNLIFTNGVADDDDSGDAGNEDGGAIHIDGDSPVTIEDNEFTDNEAAGFGGAVFVENNLYPEGTATSRVTLRDNDFGGVDDGNASGDGERGGGAYIYSNGDLDAIGNGFAENESVNGSGGGLYSAVYGRTTLDDNDFQDNTAALKGGGATLRVCGDARLTNNSFEDNSLERLLLFRAQGDVSGSIFGRAGGPMGAGLHMSDDPNFCDPAGRVGAAAADEEFDVVQGDNDFNGNVIHDGYNQGDRGTGAGEGTQDLDVKSTSDSFVKNLIQTPGGEGAGYAQQNTESNVFEGRNLVAAGNAVLAEPPEETTRVLSAAQVPDGEGGGIYIGAIGNELRLFNATVVSNQAAAGSGISGGDCDGLTLHNGIVHGNTGAEDEIHGFDCVERVSALAEPGEPRDVQFTDTCIGTSPHVGVGNICANPLLVDPANGNVKQTASSPTLDRASNGLAPSDLPTDWEGDARIQAASAGGAAVVDMGADEANTPAAPVIAPSGCLNAGGNVNGKNLGPARLGRDRPTQRQLFSGAQLRTRLGLDKYCAIPVGWFRLGYPNARLNRPFGRALRRSVSNRVVLILTSSPRFSVSGITPRKTTATTARRLLKKESRFRVGKNTWYVVRASGKRLLLVKAQGGLVREIGVGDARVASTRKLLYRYLRAWEGGF